MLNYFIIHTVYSIYLVNHLKDSQKFQKSSKKRIYTVYESYNTIIRKAFTYPKPTQPNFSITHMFSKG